MAKENQTYILCDEVYRSPDQPSICDEYEKGISTSSLSKMFSLAGLRLGWIKGPAEVIAAVNVRRDYSIISTGPLIDALALIALQNKENILARSCAIIDANKASLTSWLKDNPAFSIVMPQAGTVGFLKYDAPIASADFARYLLDQTGVFYVPGSCFDSESHLRLGLTADHGYEWAENFDRTIKAAVLTHQFDIPVNYQALPNAAKAVPTSEHYNPFLVALGASSADDQVTVWNDYRELGSMSMTSYRFG